MTNLRIFLTKQRGAMFGMDARVALSIFGVLAAIGGYTMLGRVDTARAAKLIRELQTLEKGFAALQADFGQPIIHDATLGFDPSDTASLFAALRTNPDDKTYFKWSGPYVNADFPIDHETYGTWGSAIGNLDFINKAMCFGATSTCYLWLSLTDVPENVFNEVNLVIDENGGSVAEASPQDDGRVVYDGTTLHFRVIGWNIQAGRTVK